MIILKKKKFSLAPGTREHVPIIIESTVESNQSLSPTSGATHTSMSYHFLIFWRLGVFIDVFDEVISRLFKQWSQNYSY